MESFRRVRGRREGGREGMKESHRRWEMVDIHRRKLTVIQ